ncbi:hypothetical protein HCJ66_14830 [Listeria sp. FSL L7-1582]|uniref:hypothetical protein n=1 Tax=Listeria portnoyi TaxID=2713504 RepID=UPI00164D83CC|nr:hypothetical protein [Listeria portnoyi]MBC6310813.1 hypothetical protein [Listeria portnoyi]
MKYSGDYFMPQLFIVFTYIKLQRNPALYCTTKKRPARGGWSKKGVCEGTPQLEKGG